MVRWPVGPGDQHNSAGELHLKKLVGQEGEMGGAAQQQQHDCVLIRYIYSTDDRSAIFSLISHLNHICLIATTVVCCLIRLYRDNIGD